MSSPTLRSGSAQCSVGKFHAISKYLIFLLSLFLFISILKIGIGHEALSLASITKGFTPAAVLAPRGGSTAATPSRASVTCGGPTEYCSRTDLEIAQLPSSPPNVGRLSGANVVIKDPDFGNRILRVTDANTNPAHRNFTFGTASSADENLWNTDSTFFIVYDNGANIYPFSFNAQTMQASRLYASKFPESKGLMMWSSGEWSRKEPQILYQMHETKILQYDFSDQAQMHLPRLVFDYASGTNCLGKGFTARWRTSGGVSAGDAVFAEGFSDTIGGQDGPGANYIAVYTVGKGCRVLNTASGQVTGDWGPTGTVDIPDRVHIHNVKLSKDGNWAIFTWNHCMESCQDGQPFFWQVGTTHVATCAPAKSCYGHWTSGYSHWENSSVAPASQELRPFSNPPSFVELIPFAGLAPGVKHPFDLHQSWNNASPDDNSPVFVSTYSNTAPFPAPWYNEIVGVATDGSGKVWRFAHTFDSTQSHRFTTSQAIGAVSQDGRFFMWSSDWMNTLGSETGSPNCTPRKDCRGDVFVVELK